jgi:hypothetical protein
MFTFHAELKADCCQSHKLHVVQSKVCEVFQNSPMEAAKLTHEAESFLENTKSLRQV